MSKELVLRGELSPVPAIIERAGGNARFAYEEVFKATINNEHTRGAYARIVKRLLNWREKNDLELRQITPGLAGDYMGQTEGSAPTKNQPLAALRHFFDAMVTRHVVPLNPSLRCAGRIGELSPERRIEVKRAVGAALAWRDLVDLDAH